MHFSFPSISIYLSIIFFFVVVVVLMFLRCGSSWTAVRNAIRGPPGRQMLCLPTYSTAYKPGSQASVHHAGLTVKMSPLSLQSENLFILKHDIAQQGGQ